MESTRHLYRVYNRLIIGFLKQFTKTIYQNLSNCIISLIIKFYNSSFCTQLINPRKFKFYYEGYEYKIEKFFTIINWDLHVYFSFIINLKFILSIKLYPSKLKYKISNQHESEEDALFQVDKGKQYPENGDILRFKIQLDGDKQCKLNLLQIYMFDENMINLCHISVELYNKQIEQSMLWLYYNEIINTKTEMCNKLSKNFYEGYSHIELNPENIWYYDHISAWNEPPDNNHVTIIK